MNVIYFPNFSLIGRTVPKDTCTSDRGNASSQPSQGTILSKKRSATNLP